MFSNMLIIQILIMDTNDKNTDLCMQYKNYIADMKKLDEEMLDNIRNMSIDQIMEIIIAMNDTIEYTTDIIKLYL